MILGRVSFWIDWGDRRVYDVKMGVWARVGGGAGSLRVLMLALRSIIDLIFTCRVQRALICGLE